MYIYSGSKKNEIKEQNFRKMDGFKMYDIKHHHAILGEKNSHVLPHM